MSTYERVIYNTLKTVYICHRSHVPTVIIADMVGKHDRSIRNVLTRLESRGLVERRGQRGGWKPALAA